MAVGTPDPEGDDLAPTRWENATLWLRRLAGLLSFLLLAALVWWGYQQVMRNIHGIPVITAPQEPYRVAPEDPGGSSAAHQGLSVNEIAASGEAAGPVDQLTLAPAPEALAPEDLPMAELPRTPEMPEPGTAEPAGAGEDISAETAAEPLADPPAETADPTASGNAPDTTTAGGPERPAEDGPEDAIDLAVRDALSDAVDPDAAPADAADTRQARLAARRPEPRPAGLARPVRAQPEAGATPAASAEAEAAAPDVAGRPAEELDPAEIPAGTRMVQLGAYASAEIARGEWRRLDARFGDLLVDKKRVIEKAESGGRTFYRLRATGFGDVSDARRFCSALLAENTDCIPVRKR